MQANCGLVIDGETLINQNGVLTLVDYEGDANRVYSSICGGLCYNGNIFKIQNGVLTIKTDEKEEFNNIVISQCGVKFDGEYFTIQDGKLVSTYEPFDWSQYFYASQDEPLGGKAYTRSDRYKLSTAKIPKDQRLAIWFSNSSGTLMSNMEFSGYKDRFTKDTGADKEFSLYSSTPFTSNPKEQSSFNVYSHPVASMSYKTILNILAFDNNVATAHYVKTGEIDESHVVTI